MVINIEQDSDRNKGLLKKRAEAWMDQIELDMLSVTAYSDASHARDRELWRGFLSYALPVVMAFDTVSIEKYLAEAVVYNFEELTIKGGGQASKTEVLRFISALLAKEIGVPPEFALASFFEGEVPTKLYKIHNLPAKKKKKTRQEDAMIGAWLACLAKVQSDKKFIKNAEKWRHWLEPDGYKNSQVV